MKFAVRQLVLGLLISMCCAGAASAQYMHIVSDNPTDNTTLRATGTTILTISMDTNHDKNGSTQTCNSHTTSSCGAPTSANPLDMFSYTIALHVVGGTVTWGTFSASDANYTDVSPQIQSDTEVEINKSRPTGTFTPPGLSALGTLPVTIVSGTPSVQVQIGASGIDPFGFGSGFGTECDGYFFANTYVVGDPTDPCGNVNGIAGDWFDWDQINTEGGNVTPAITAPGSASAIENTAMSPINVTATDADAGNTLTITQAGKPADLTFTTNSPGTSPRTASISGTPGFSDAGTYNIVFTVNDGTGTVNASNSASTSLTIANTDRAPTLDQPANMTVNQGSTAEQTITGSDPDNDPLTFVLVSGPTFVSIVNPTNTSATVRLVPGFSATGTSGATVRASDGTLFDDKSFTITVNKTNRAPTLNQPNNMTVDAGTTADQTITGTDPDSDPLTFTKAAGPTYMTVTTTNGTTGNIHLAPGGGDVGSAAATVTASDGSLTNSKSLTITVNAGANNPPVLTQPNNMTVAEGATTNQTLNATDADGQALTFSLASGPTYATVTTTSPGTGTATGNLHLAPGFSDAGTAAATVRVSDGSATNDKSLTITVTNTNRAPTLTQPSNMTVTAGATADQTLNATDPDGDALTFTKTSGPTYVTVTTTNPTTGNVHLAPGVSDAGTASVSVSASDGSLSDSKSFSVTVNAAANNPPVLAQPADMTVAEGATANQSISATDADGDPLSFSKVSGPSYATVTTTTAGTGTGTGNIHLAPGFSDSGTATLAVRADDGKGGTSDKSLTITVTNVNRAPTLTQPSNMTVAEGATADQTLTATDPDGDPLAFSKSSGPAYMTVTTTSPGTGTGTGNVHLAPGFTDAGSTTVVVRASDGTLFDEKNFDINVTPTNRAPTLNAISDMTVTENSTADQTITASDPDGDALTFAKVTGPTFLTVTTTNGTTGNVHLAPTTGDAGTYNASASASDGSLSDTKSFTIDVQPFVANNNPPVLAQPGDMTVAEGSTDDQTISATDADGDPIAFSKVAGPTFVTVTTTSAGTGTGSGNIHLAPGFADAGTYGVTVRASDGKGGSDDKSLTVTVTNVNRAPILNAIANMTVTEGVTADQTITASDPDGDILTFAKVTGPTFMTVTTTNATSGNVHLAPTIGDAGTYGASASASDGDLSDTRTFTITVIAPTVNHAPVLTQPNDMTVNENATADQAISATDEDGDPITFSKVAGPTFMAVTTTSPGTGSGSGNIHLAPNFTDAGTYGATVRAEDGQGGSDEKSLTITVNNTNRAPTLNAISDMTVTEGATADQTITGSDPDGDALTFSKASGPAFMTVIPASSTSATVHLAPGTGTAGTYGASASASDGSLSDTKSFTITVNPVTTNHAPVLTQPVDMTVAEGATADQQLQATDQDGDNLTFSKVGGPTFMTVSSTGDVHLAPGFADAGTYTGTAAVSDGSLSDQKSFMITVTNVNRAPVADAGGPYSGVVGVAVNFSGTGSSDPDGDALTYSWDFDATDGITQDATGATPSHIYLVQGTYTVTLTVSDGSLSDTDTASASIASSNGFAATATVDGGDKAIRLQSNKPFWCVHITPVNGDFNLSDIIPSSVRLSYNSGSIASVNRRLVAENGSVEICFAKSDLRTLLGSVGNGRNTVTLTITGDLQGGGSFQASIDILIQRNGGPAAAANHGNGNGNGDFFAWASPNPLNPNTLIRFSLTRPGSVSLNVYDIQGRLVKGLVDEFMDAGLHDVRWDGSTRAGTHAASGVYFYVLQTAEGTIKSQLVVAK